MSDPFELIPKKPQPSRPPAQTRQPAGAQRVSDSTDPPARPPAPPPRKSSGFGRGFGSGVLAFLVICAFFLGSGLIGYALIAADLPQPRDLSNRTSTFQTTRIYDREGNLLNEAFDPNEGLRTALPVEQFSPWLVNATIATEDANFFTHPGVDLVALTRALYYAFRERGVVSGASTIPQQLVKMLFLSPEQTVTRKVKEAILASEITRRFTKEQILEIYLNEIFYGNHSYGAAAAAKTYFNKDAADLTLAEASLLAGLPQLPAYYDPYTHPDRAKERQAVVLGLMVEGGVLTQEEADAAWLEPLQYSPQEFDLEAPHFTLYVRQQVEQLLGPDALFRRGLEVETTLDPRLQEEAERIVRENVNALAGNNVSNGALVALDPESGELLALVGSADFDNVEIDGQVNMALAPRQPGSTIKPLVYLAAFEQPDKPPSERWTPGTLIADIQEAFPDGVNPPYVPANYDGTEHGLLPLRQALGNSYNIPAVRALQTVGLEPFLKFAQRLGITTLTRPDYGLSLALGAGEAPLEEMTTAFATIANNGVYRPPVAITRIRDANGVVLCEQGTAQPCDTQPGAGQQVINPADAFLMSDILSDNEARSAAFGPNSMLRLDRPAAVKTGTTNDIRDILTIGYTPQLATGVWVGNADNTPMSGVSGVSGAAPIWNEFMTTALAGEPVVPFTPPPGVRQFEVCSDTGTAPSPACPTRGSQWFAEDRPPLPSDKDLWRTFRVDRETGQLATEFTPAENVEERKYKVYPETYRDWANSHGIAQPPFAVPDAGVGLPTSQPGETPFASTPSPLVRVAIASPQEGETVSGLVTVYGTVDVPNLFSYELQYGESHDPGAFSPPVAGPFSGTVVNNALAQWETTGLSEGPYVLRLLARDTSGAEFESRVRLFVAEPLPTPGPIATLVPVTLEPLPTETPVLEATPTWTPEIALSTETPIVEVATPTWTPEFVVPITDTFTITSAGVVTQ